MPAPYSQGEQRRIADLVALVEALADVENDTTCSLPRAAKEAVHAYVSTWILPRARKILDRAVGIKVRVPMYCDTEAGAMLLTQAHHAAARLAEEQACGR